MKFTKAELEDAFLIEMEPREDERGMFARMYDVEEFKKHGVEFVPVQMNNSSNIRKGTVRGLHYQKGDHAEEKIFRCITGSVFSVAVDLRPDSPTYKKWMGIVLSTSERNMVYYPAGCAVGYQALEDGAEIIYAVSAAYAPDAEGGIRYNDPAFGIDWPIKNGIIVSDKDEAWQNFRGSEDQIK